jgi:hypothetical protein
MVLLHNISIYIFKHLLYQVNGNKDLIYLFKIKLFQIQQDYWIAECIGDK